MIVSLAYNRHVPIYIACDHQVEKLKAHERNILQLLYRGESEADISRVSTLAADFGPLLCCVDFNFDAFRLR